MAQWYRIQGVLQQPLETKNDYDSKIKTLNALLARLDDPAKWKMGKIWLLLGLCCTGFREQRFGSSLKLTTCTLYMYISILSRWYVIFGVNFVINCSAFQFRWFDMPVHRFCKLNTPRLYTEVSRLLRRLAFLIAGGTSAKPDLNAASCDSSKNQWINTIIISCIMFSLSLNQIPYDTDSHVIHIYLVFGLSKTGYPVFHLSLWWFYSNRQHYEIKGMDMNYFLETCLVQFTMINVFLIFLGMVEGLIFNRNKLLAHCKISLTHLRR